MTQSINQSITATMTDNAARQQKSRQDGEQAQENKKNTHYSTNTCPNATRNTQITKKQENPPRDKT